MSDKLLHMGVCAMVAVTTIAALAIVSSTSASLNGCPEMYAACRPAIALGGLFSALSIGVGKEYGDSKAQDNKWSWGDVIADVAGGLIGTLIGILIF